MIYVDKYTNPTFNVSPSDKKEGLYSKVQFRIIANKYVCIVFLYLPTNECAFTEVIANINVSFAKLWTQFWIYKVPQGNISNKYGSIFDHLQQFNQWCLHWIYSRHQNSASYFTLGGIIDPWVTQ